MDNNELLEQEVVFEEPKPNLLFQAIGGKTFLVICIFYTIMVSLAAISNQIWLHLFDIFILIGLWIAYSRALNGKHPKGGIVAVRVGVIVKFVMTMIVYVLVLAVVGCVALYMVFGNLGYNADWKELLQYFPASFSLVVAVLMLLNALLAYEVIKFIFSLRALSEASSLENQKINGAFPVFLLINAGISTISLPFIFANNTVSKILNSYPGTAYGSLISTMVSNPFTTFLITSLFITIEIMIAVKIFKYNNEIKNIGVKYGK